MSCIECGTCRAACGVDAIFSECRFPDLMILNFASNPFENREDMPETMSLPEK
jgi:ferredoxin